MNPQRAVIPIFGTLPNGRVDAFLGSAFFVSSAGHVLTADHVIAGWSGGLAFSYPDDLARVVPLSVVERDSGLDIALLKAARHVPDHFLRVRQGTAVISNAMLLTLEYSLTATTGNRINVSPSTRMGHVTRQRDVEQYGRAGKNSLELSFPALRGASGAPVMRADNFEVWGVIIANVEHHLLPCQIETVLDAENDIYEEVRYMLPQALAVDISHTLPMLQRHIAL